VRRDDWFPAWSNGSDEVDPNQMQDWSSRPMIPAPWPVQFWSCFLRLFPNIQLLILDGEFVTDPHHLARDFAPLIEAGVLFQQLQDVIYINERSSTYEAMSPFFALPRLRTLMVNEFDQTSSQSPKRSNLNDGTSSIERIAPFRTSLQRITWRSFYNGMCRRKRREL
jgi:hypothetical protein